MTAFQEVSVSFLNCLLHWTARVILGSVLISCGKNPGSDSAFKDVANQPTNTQRLTSFLWSDNGTIFRGLCEPGKPLLRRYCQISKASISWEQAERTLYENRRIDESTLLRDHAELLKQLEAIDVEIRQNPTDVSLSMERVRVAKAANSVQTSLTTIQSQIAVIDSLIQRLKHNDIVYVFSRQTGFYIDEAPHLGRLEASFITTANPQPPVSAPPTQDYLTWRDNDLQINYLLLATPLTREIAESTCKSLRPGRWNLIINVTQRLLASPIIGAVPATGEGFMKLVWGDQILTGGGHAAVLVRQGVSGDFESSNVRLEQNTRLVAICEQFGN